MIDVHMLSDIWGSLCFTFRYKRSEGAQIIARTVDLYILFS